MNDVEYVDYDVVTTSAAWTAAAAEELSTAGRLDVKREHRRADRHMERAMVMATLSAAAAQREATAELAHARVTQ